MSPFMKGQSLAARTAGKLVFLLSLLCLVSLTCQAGVILSENFDALTPQLSATSVGAFHTIGGTNVDIVGGGLFGYLCVSPASGNCVDLGGSGGNAQGVLQSVNSITLQPGTNYLLSFDLIGSQRGPTTSTTVDFGPYSQTFVLASNDVSSGIVVNALVKVSFATTTYLTFTDNSPNDNIGSILDNVSIVSVPTPEPGTLALFGSGILGLAGMLRRKISL
jgi:hypothetical protein